MSSREITIRGVAPPGAEVRLNVQFWFDPRVIADARGNWEYRATLRDGRNDFEFFLQEARETRARVTVVYVREGT